MGLARVVSRQPQRVAGELDGTELVNPGSVKRSPHRIATTFLASSELLSLLIAGFVWADFVATTPGFDDELVGLGAVLGTAFVLFSKGQFRINVAGHHGARSAPEFGAVAVGLGTAVFVAALFGLEMVPGRRLLWLALLLLASAWVGRTVAHLVLRSLWAKGRLRCSALVYGSGELARELAIEMQLQPERGIDVVGFIDDGSGDPAHLPAPVWSADVDPAELMELVGADRLIVVPTPEATDSRTLAVARAASGSGRAVHVLPRFHQLGLGFDSTSPDLARGYPLVRLQRAVHPQLSLRLKRVFDVVVAGGALVALLPLLAVVALLVKLTSRGPVLIGQERVGQGSKPIVVWKFRSMRVSDAADTEWDASHRITRLGRFIRRTNIDELPQLFTIAKGDMSFVGPRPERPYFVEQFRADVADYDDRHRMPVGLTGLAQVIGLRGDTSIGERVKYDNLYIDQWSFRTDLVLLVYTPLAVARQRRQADRANQLQRGLHGRLRERAS